MGYKQHLLLRSTSQQGYTVADGGSTFLPDMTFTPPLASTVYSGAWLPDGSRMYVGTTDMGAQIYGRTGKGYKKLGVLGPTTSKAVKVVVSYDGRFIAYATDVSPYLYVFERTGDTYGAVPLDTAPPAIAWGDALYFSPKDYTLIMSTNTTQPTLRAWRYNNGTFTSISTAADNYAYAHCGAWTPDGTKLILGANGSAPYIRMLSIGTGITTLPQPSWQPSSWPYWVAMSPDGKYVAGAIYAGTVFVYKLTGSTLSILPAPAAVGNACTNGQFSPDGKFLAVRYGSGLAIYSVDSTTDTFTKIATQPAQPADNGRDGNMRFSPILYDGITSVYDDAIRAIMNGDVNNTSLKMMLLANPAVFDSTNTTLAQVLAANTEASGGGWPEGGITLNGVSFVAVNGGAKMTVTDTGQDITSASITTAAAVVYDDASTNKRPLAFIDFGGAVTLPAGQRLNFNFSVDGLLLVTRS